MEFAQNAQNEGERGENNTGANIFCIQLVSMYMPLVAMLIICIWFSPDIFWVSEEATAFMFMCI